MVDTEEIYDKSVWPLFTPGLHWALSDTVRNIGSLSRCEDDAVEYIVPTEDLPDGELGLWHVNALRDIRIDISEWPSFLRKRAESVALCLGSKALQSVPFDGSDRLTFSMFSNDTLLPLFVIDDDVLTVRIQFKESLIDVSNVPKHAVDATGLLVRIKERSRPFFVAACEQSTLTWDGHQSRVFATATIRNNSVSLGPNADSDKWRDRRSSVADKQLFDMRRAAATERMDTSLAENDDSTFEDVWQALHAHSNRTVAARPTSQFRNTTTWTPWTRASPARPLWEPLESFNGTLSGPEGPDALLGLRSSPTTSPSLFPETIKIKTPSATSLASSESSPTQPPGLITPKN